MRLNTASAVIAFAGRLEEESAAFYERLATAHPARASRFLDLARENRKNKARIERSYYGVITDAIEGSFTFDLAVDGYTLDPGLPADYRQALAQAGALEERIIRFYREAARQSRALLADIPGVMAAIARKREARVAELESLARETQGPGHFGGTTLHGREDAR